MTAGAAAGCDPFGGRSGATDSDVTPELTSLLAGTVALGDQYDAAIAKAPSLSSRLSVPRDAHRAHAQALAQALGTSAPEPAPTTGGQGGDPGTLLAGLVDAETKGQDAARTACLSAPPRLAPLVGSIAAARASHREILT